MNNLRIGIFVFLFSFWKTAGVFAQPVFQKTIGGNGHDIGSSIIQAVDGGYAICGYTDSYGAGRYDVYVVKLDSNASLQWTKTIGTNYSDQGYTIIQTKDGGYAVSGVTSTNIFRGYEEVYVVKLDVMGNLQWTKTIGGSDDDLGYSIIQTKDGGFSIAGFTRSFGAGDWDIYVVKLDSIGNLNWTRTIGGTRSDVGFSIIQTSDEGYAVCGYTESFSVIAASVYVVKLDSSGNLQWTRIIGGGIDGEWGYDIIQTSDGGYVIGGSSWSYGAGGLDIYVVKLDNSGNLKWTRTVGRTSWDEGYSICQTNDGGYAVCGKTGYFGGFENLFEDVYVVKLDSSGNLQWTRIIGKSGDWDDWGNSIIQAKDGGYAICGSTFSFSSNSWDVYILKLDSNGNTCGISDSGGIVDTGGSVSMGGITSSGGTTGSGGTASSGGVLNCECYDTTLSALYSVTACNSYKSPSGKYTWNTSGIYTDIIPATPGCDSFITINLIINKGSDSTISITACNDYKSPSGNNIWTNTGIYDDTIPNSAGCDSAITVNLTINKINKSVSQSGDTLTANASGVTYQWVDCNNNFVPIAGQTSQNFIPASNGSYAVIVTDSNCIDTSSCYAITSIGVIENSFAKSIRLFPNPTTGVIHIVPGNNYQNLSIAVRNILGKQPLIRGFTSMQAASLQISEPAGFYIIEVNINNESAKFKVIKTE